MSKKELRDKYNEELPRLEGDIEALKRLQAEQDKYIPMLITLAAPTDSSLAETVVQYNSKIAEAVAITSTAIGCGCSVAGIGTSSFVGVSTYYYEIAKASMENISSGGYGGDDPYGDAGTVSLTSGIGSNTTINISNLGKGVDTFVGSGSSVLIRVINDDPLMPSICGTTCAEFEALRQAALNAATSAQSGRSTFTSQSNAFKEEIQDYEIRKWAAKAGEVETQAKIDRIKAFLPNIQE